RAALAWSGAKAQGEAGLRLGGALGKFWTWRGYWTEGRERLAGLLALPGAQARSAARVGALHCAGLLAWQQGDLRAARALLEEGLAISRELGDKFMMLWSLSNLGNVAHLEGDLGAARALLEESLAIARELGEKRFSAMALHRLGLVAREQRD